MNRSLLVLFLALGLFCTLPACAVGDDDDSSGDDDDSSGDDDAGDDDDAAGDDDAADDDDSSGDDDDDDTSDDDDSADDDDAADDDNDDVAHDPWANEGDDPGECADGADNDLDGDYDCSDSECGSSPACENQGGCSVSQLAPSASGMVGALSLFLLGFLGTRRPQPRLRHRQLSSLDEVP